MTDPVLFDPTTFEREALPDASRDSGRDQASVGSANDNTTVKRVYIDTQGCQMNVYDSDRLTDLLGERCGYVLTDDPAQADLLLMNTCSIREKAQEKVFSELGRWRQLKEARPDVIIGVGGCVASQEGEALQQRAPQVDIVFGPQTLHRVPELLSRLNDLPIQQRQSLRRKGEHRIGLVDISFPEIEKFDHLPAPRVEGYKAFVSIMEGCSKYCSFCVVPYTRGEEISRPLDDVLAEVVTLAGQGVREITLLGQNVNGYCGAAHDGQLVRFAELLRLVAQIPGIDRLRYTTSHPLEFGDDLIECYRDLPQLASHVHLPVQSGADAVLAAMKRNHTIDVYIEKIRKLREARPDIHLSSDFIIGFPGEQDADFEETYQLAADLDFDHSYSFLYSRRPGTPASDLVDDTPEAVKKARLSRFQQRIRQQSIAHTDAMLGTLQRVLVESWDEQLGCLVGSADNLRLVEIAGQPDQVGELLMVRIERILSMNRVIGRQLTPDESLALVK